MIDLVISPRAELELREIWRYIAADKPAVADAVLLRIDSKLQVLREFPDIGTVRNDIRPGARLLVEGPYLVLYEHRPDDAVVEVVAIVDGRRDLGTMF